MRAQTETLGFVLVFSLIVVSIGIIYGTGVAGLDDARTAEHINNMERAFDVLTDNVEELRRNQAPSRSTEISLHGGSMRLGDTVTMTIAAHNASNASRNVSYSVNTRPILYERADVQLTYVAGAIVRDDRGAATMQRAPRWLVDSERAVLPLVVVYPASNDTAVGGKGTLHVVTKWRSQSLSQFTAGAEDVDVTVTVDSPRADAWRAYFERAGLSSVDADASDGEITYGFTTGAVYVPRTAVATELNI